jgi:hypothetical protein
LLCKLQKKEKKKQHHSLLSYLPFALRCAHTRALHERLLRWSRYMSAEYADEAGWPAIGGEAMDTAGAYDAYGDFGDDQEEANDLLYLQMYTSGREASMVMQPLAVDNSDTSVQQCSTGRSAVTSALGSDDQPERRISPQSSDAAKTRDTDTAVHMVDEKEMKPPPEPSKKSSRRSLVGSLCAPPPACGPRVAIPRVRSPPHSYAHTDTYTQTYMHTDIHTRVHRHVYSRDTQRDNGHIHIHTDT